MSIWNINFVLNLTFIGFWKCWRVGGWDYICPYQKQKYMYIHFRALSEQGQRLWGDLTGRTIFHETGFTSVQKQSFLAVAAVLVKQSLMINSHQRQSTHIKCKGRVVGVKSDRKACLTRIRTKNVWLNSLWLSADEYFMTGSAYGISTQ